MALLGVLSLGAQAPGSKTGNPTPGTPQPDPPNLADRVTVTGCLQSVPVAAGQKEAEAGEPSDTRFVLDKVERKTAVPPGTGTSSLAAAPVAQKLRLKGIASQLQPFVGAKVEISGEVVAPASGAAGAEQPATIVVEFVQKLSSTCP